MGSPSDAVLEIGPADLPDGVSPMAVLNAADAPPEVWAEITTALDAEAEAWVGEVARLIKGRKLLSEAAQGLPSADPEFEQKHPRDLETGRFSEKPDEEEEPEEEPEDEEEPEEKGAGIEGDIGPDDSDRPEQRSLTTAGVRGTEGLGGGVTGSYLMELEDGRMTVWKPSTGEPDSFDIPAGEWYKREVAAYDVAAIVGMGDLVPVTAVREHEEVYGSVQEFLEDAEPDGRSKEAGFERDAQRARLFDVVIGNTDRHQGNWMMQGGKLKLIDHGLTFWPRPVYLMSALSRGPEADVDKEVPRGLQAPWVGAWPAIEEVLRRRGIGAKAIELAQNRYDEVTREGVTWRELRSLG